MPFKSSKQKKWMYANKPEMAKRWSVEEKRRKKRSGEEKRRNTKTKGTPKRK